MNIDFFRVENLWSRKKSKKGGGVMPDLMGHLCNFSHFWIQVFTGMTVIGLSATLPKLYRRKNKVDQYSDGDNAFI
ncbi:hypothetical protein [Desulforegula conservatrix]|uniref:hypothetical protein n=1 Tax=Desulforegula conservatrix TaxID=153026 RepID=UPI000483106D|nr:hypothetical protein [Desulforegula conservatrix]